MAIHLTEKNIVDAVKMNPSLPTVSRYGCALGGTLLFWNQQLSAVKSDFDYFLTKKICTNFKVAISYLYTFDSADSSNNTLKRVKTTNELSQLISYIQSFGYTVVLKPHITQEDKSAKTPTNYATFLNSYRTLLQQDIAIAQANNIKEIMIFTEMYKSSNANKTIWDSMIQDVKSAGIVASASLDTSVNEHNTFVSIASLDKIGLNFYPAEKIDYTTYTELEIKMNDFSYKNLVDKLYAQYKIPIFVSETGNPKANQTKQEQYYQYVLTNLNNVRNINAIYFWSISQADAYSFLQNDNIVSSVVACSKFNSLLPEKEVAQKRTNRYIIGKSTFIGTTESGTTVNIVPNDNNLIDVLTTTSFLCSNVSSLLLDNAFIFEPVDLMKNSFVKLSKTGLTVGNKYEVKINLELLAGVKQAYCEIEENNVYSGVERNGVILFSFIATATTHTVKLFFERNNVSGDFKYLLRNLSLVNYGDTHATRFKKIVTTTLREYDYVDALLSKKISRTATSILNGSETWAIESTRTNTILFRTASVVALNALTHAKCNNTSYRFSNGDYMFSSDVELINSAYNKFYLAINKSRLSTPDIAGLIAYLNANNLCIVYQTTPVETKLDIDFDFKTLETIYF